MDLISKNKILFIVEGEKTEKQIIDSLEKHNFIPNKPFIYAFCNDIYHFYSKIKTYLTNDNSYDFFRELKRLDKNKHLKDLKDDNFTETYLFFDYERQSCRANDDKIKELMDFFNEETENGKILISYPMTESLKHIDNSQDFKDNTIDCKIKNYKHIVSENSDKKYIQINKYDKSIWKELIQTHLYKMNYIINDNYSFPTQIYSQLEIFDNQKKKFIDKNNKVSVLSAFPIFIHDYFGNDKIRNLLKS